MSNSENSSAPTKATSGRPAYSPALYQIQSAIAKLLVSFRCQVKLREGQAGEKCKVTKTIFSHRRTQIGQNQLQFAERMLTFVQFLVQRSISLRLFDSLVSSMDNQLIIVF